MPAPGRIHQLHRLLRQAADPGEVLGCAYGCVLGCVQPSTTAYPAKLLTQARHHHTKWSHCNLIASPCTNRCHSWCAPAAVRRTKQNDPLLSAVCWNLWSYLVLHCCRWLWTRRHSWCILGCMPAASWSSRTAPACAVKARKSASSRCSCAHSQSARWASLLLGRALSVHPDIAFVAHMHGVTKHSTSAPASCGCTHRQPARGM